MTRLYAVYKGDSFDYMGTIDEVAAYLGTSKSQVVWYCSPTNKRRSEKSPRAIVIERIEVED